MTAGAASQLVPAVAPRGARIDLAMRNFLLNPRRTLLALLGIGFSLVLMFMQIGFLRGMRYNASILYDTFAGDFVIVSAKYLSQVNTEPFERTRLAQALLVPGVARVDSFDLALGTWKDKATKITRACALVALPRDPGLVRNPGIAAGMGALGRSRTVLVDVLSDRKLGPIAPGSVAELLGQNVTVAGNYRMGLGLYAKGAVVVSPETFALLTHASVAQVGFGLVQADPAADRDTVLAALRRALPDDVRVLDKRRLTTAEQDTYMNSKPIGIIFRVGALVSFIVGSVIFYQILSTEISNHLREYATLKSLGFKSSSIYLVGIRQALLYAVCSFLGSALVSAGLFRLISWRARMELWVDPGLAVIVLTFTLAMCAIAAVLALRRVRRADPAELF